MLKQGDGAATLHVIWFVNETGIRHILATDRGDVSTFGIKGGKRFELVEWP